jgi:hypothetical protein
MTRVYNGRTLKAYIHLSSHDEVNSMNVALLHKIGTIRLQYLVWGRKTSYGHGREKNETFTTF